MKIDKQSRVVIDVSLREAEVLAYCIAKIMENFGYLDVLPDNLHTKKVLKEFCQHLRPLI